MPGDDGTDPSNVCTGDALNRFALERGVPDVNRLCIGMVIEPDPALATDQIDDTALVTPRPATGIELEHHTRCSPGGKGVVRQLKRLDLPRNGGGSGNVGPTGAFNTPDRRPAGTDVDRSRNDQGQVLDAGAQGGGQPPLDIRSEKPGAFPGFVQTPALTGHAHPCPGLGLAQVGGMAQLGQGTAQFRCIYILLKPRHGPEMPYLPLACEDDFVSP